MGLDITIKERKEFRCPECGRLVTSIDIKEKGSSGRVWYDFLEPNGMNIAYLGERALMDGNKIVINANW